MKLHYLIPVLLAAMLLGCSETETPQPAPEESASAYRTEQEAMEVALTLPSIFEENESRATKTCASVVKVANPSRNDEKTLIYAVNYADGEGYALIPAAKNALDVLAYVEDGSYDENSTNPGLALFMDAAHSYLDALPAGTTIGTFPADRPVITTQSIMTRTYTLWGQRYPEGIYCPNGISGCVQTAEAIALAFDGTVTSVTLTYEGRDKDVQELDWTKIRRHDQSVSHYQKSSHLSSCKADEEIHNALGRICRQFGVENKANYDNPKSTPASHYRCRYYLAERLPGRVTDFIAFKTGGELYNCLAEKQCIAYMYGAADSTAHVWICDGGKWVSTTSKMPMIDGTIKTIVDNDYYYHYNWGWRGIDNGYFADGVFDSTKGESRSNYNVYQSYFLIYK